MDVFKIDQSLSAGLGSAPAPDTLTPEVSFDAGSEFNLSFFDGPEENSTQGFSDPGSVGSASASPPPGTPASIPVNPSNAALPIVQVPPGIVIKQGLFHLVFFFFLFFFISFIFTIYLGGFSLMVIILSRSFSLQFFLSFFSYFANDFGDFFFLFSKLYVSFERRSYRSSSDTIVKSTFRAFAFVSRAVWIYESERGKKPRIITMNVVIDSILRFKDRSVFTRLSKSI